MKNNNFKKSFLFFSVTLLILIGIQSENPLEAMESKESKDQDYSINSIAECRQVFLDLALWLDNAIETDSNIESIYQLFSQVRDRDFQLIMEYMPFRSKFVRSVRTLTSRDMSTTNLGNSEDSSSCNPSATLCLPEYPSGKAYDVFTASLKWDIFDYLVDTPGSLEGCGDEHTNADAVANTIIIQQVFAYLTDVSEFIECFEIAELFGCIAKKAFAVAWRATDIILTQCAYQDGLVDSAEIRAAYKNTLMLSDDLNAHDSNLAIHDANITQNIGIHDVKLDAHDVHLGQEFRDHNLALSDHDAKMTGKTDLIQFTLDNVIEPKKVHLQVIELKEKREFLVSTSEGGKPVSNIEFISVRVSERARVSFVDVTASTSANMVGPGTYLVKINLPKGSENASLYTFEVKHTNDVVDHFGFTLFDRGN